MAKRAKEGAKLSGCYEICVHLPYLGWSFGQTRVYCPMMDAKLFNFIIGQRSETWWWMVVKKMNFKSNYKIQAEWNRNKTAKSQRNHNEGERKGERRSKWMKLKQSWNQDLTAKWRFIRCFHFTHSHSNHPISRASHLLCLHSHFSIRRLRQAFMISVSSFFFWLRLNVCSLHSLSV